MEIKDDDEAQTAEDHVHDHAGGDDEHPLADRLVLERSGIVLVLVRFGALTHHRHVAAQGQNGNLVERLAAPEAAPGKRGPEAQAESLHVDVAPFGHQEVSQFVDENHKPEADGDYGGFDNAFDAEVVVQGSNYQGERQEIDGVLVKPGHGR